jgi:hypothetical protein
MRDLLTCHLHVDTNHVGNGMAQQATRYIAHRAWQSHQRGSAHPSLLILQGRARSGQGVGSSPADLQLHNVSKRQREYLRSSHYRVYCPVQMAEINS